MNPQSGTPNELPSARRPLRWLFVLVAVAVVAGIVWANWPKRQLPAAITVTGADGEPEEAVTAEAVRAAYTASVPEARRLTFFAPFRSYAHLGDLRNELEQTGYEPQFNAHHVRVPADLPPSDLDIVTVKGYRHLDQPGTLELQFFNDRLYQLEFQPDDARAYREKFREQWQLAREKSGRSEFIAGPLRIASSLDLAVSDVGQALHTRPYALWQDLRLIKQRDDWDQQFARAAAQ